MGRKKPRQQSLWVPYKELKAGPGSPFYERLNEVFAEIDFDRRVENLCAPYYDDGARGGRPSIAPGVYFRMLFAGFFENLRSERGIAWRCADSLSLRAFLGYGPSEATPEHSSLSNIRRRLPPEVMESVFRLILELVHSDGLLRGCVIGVDSTTIDANASTDSLQRKDSGQSYEEYIGELAKEDGLEEPSKDELRQWDRKRKGKKTSNKEWESKTDPDSRMGKTKDGRYRQIYKAENAVDLETGAIIEANINRGDVGDTDSLLPTLEKARDNILSVVDKDDPDDPEPPSSSSSDSKAKASPKVDLVTDKGYYKAELLPELEKAGFRPYIPAPEIKGQRRFDDKGGEATKKAFKRNEHRMEGKRAKAYHRRRGELVERHFAHICDTGGERRTTLRGRENIEKRYRIAAAGANLALIMRTRFGVGKPRAWADALLANLAFWLRFCRSKFLLARFGTREIQSLRTSWMTSSIA